MNIKIYARTYGEAAKLAAQMNLSLRHWEYEGPSEIAALDPWADVGTVMDYYQGAQPVPRGNIETWPKYDR